MRCRPLIERTRKNAKEADRRRRESTHTLLATASVLWRARAAIRVTRRILLPAA